MLRKRFVAASTLLVLLAILFVLDAALDRPVVWVVMLIAICGAGAVEFCGMCRRTGSGYGLVTWLTVGGTVLMATTPYLVQLNANRWGVGSIDAFVLAAVVALSFVLYCRGGDLSRALLGVSLTVFCAVYVGLLCSFIIRIRIWSEAGVYGILFLVLATKVGDIAAYFGGKRFGHHRMAPVISPNKTMEGGVASFLATVAVGVLICRITGIFEPVHGLLCSMMLGVVGQLGDLSESVVKRALGTKDSGSAIPGYGGVLDLIDSFFFAAPAVYLYAKLTGH